MDEARDYAQDLKKEGILVFTLAVGVEKNIFLLKEIASKETYYLEVESYSELVRRIGLLKDNLAQGCTVEGEPGKDAVDGEPGKKGAKGPQGDPGVAQRGLDGKKGQKGLKGEDADLLKSKGSPGEIGSKGQAGEKGKIWRFNTSCRRRCWLFFKNISEFSLAVVWRRQNFPQDYFFANFA